MGCACIDMTSTRTSQSAANTRCNGAFSGSDSERHGLLFTNGFKPRIATYDGFEVPVPLAITVQHGEGACCRLPETSWVSPSSTTTPVSWGKGNQSPSNIPTGLVKFCWPTPACHLISGSTISSITLEA